MDHGPWRNFNLSAVQTSDQGSAPQTSDQGFSNPRYWRILYSIWFFKGLKWIQKY